MDTSGFHYDHCHTDYSGRPNFRDSHSNISSNISISAVISSSCVVLEGLKDSSDCLSATFPVEQGGQSFFSSDFHNSLPTTILNGDLRVVPNVADGCSVSNSLNCSSVDLSDGNHFFQSAATEFMAHDEELNINPEIVHEQREFLEQEKQDVNMTIRSQYGDTFIADSMEDVPYHSSPIFNQGHHLVNNGRFDLYSPDHTDIEFPIGCRFGTAANSSYHPNNLHIDQSATYQYALHSEISPRSMEDSSVSFTPVCENTEQFPERTVHFLANDTCIQSQSPPSFNKSVIVSHFQDDETNNLNSNFRTLHKHTSLLHQNNLDYCNSQYTMATSYNPSYTVSEADGVSNTCETTNDSVFRDSLRRLHNRCRNESRKSLSESNEEIKYTTTIGLEDTPRSHVPRHKYTSESDSESRNTNQYFDQNMNSVCVHEEQGFVSKSSCDCNERTANDSNDVGSRISETKTKLGTSGKSKRKHAETVEILQQHLETLEDRRKTIAPSCSALTLLRQRSHVTEENSGNDDSVTSVLDVDHMMCSGVTVAGFKPRAIIRKRSKTTTPTDIKDIEYWQKRQKNNDSARKSRESKKEKEKNFYKRALELEYENLYLQECLSLAEAELATLGHPFVPPVFGDQCYY